MVEELALLRAAELARAAGKKGIVIITRKGTRYVTNMTAGGSPQSADPDGFYCELSVVFVDPGALPDAYKDNAWRVINADAVYDQLAPIYYPAPKK